MTDRESVVYDLERCTCHVPDACRDCSKYASGTGLKCMENLMMDALELLKEQKEVEPILSYGTFRCGNCGNIVGYNDGYGRGYQNNFCSACGKKVKWE